eukprot:GHRR01023233.1.p1 GENE.GHRR01023233.1~~GHRR01023233.1.p1  ORF type:complete len:113 (-),score=34.27 GHRR01023233.1:482-820(-)
MASGCRSCVLSTVSSHPSSSGFPFGSVVEFAVDSEGRPLLATSTLSPHTADLQADGRCSITVTAPGFKVWNADEQGACLVTYNLSGMFYGNIVANKYGQRQTNQHRKSMHLM